jgi:hypothetical protein
MINPALIAAAKRQLAKYNIDRLTASLPLADRELLRKYPKHTLVAARLIDATPLCRGTLLPDQVGHTPGEDFNSLQWQANGELPSRQ